MGAVRLATFLEMPARKHRRWVRLADRTGRRHAWRWVGGDTVVASDLVGMGIDPGRVSLIAPGIAPASLASPVGVVDLRQSLGLADRAGPVVLLAGEGAAARHDLGLWAAAVVQTMSPQIRAVVREHPRAALRGDFADPGVERFFLRLADENLLRILPAEIPWARLVQAADVVLATPDRHVPGGAILAAMAVGVPVITTPFPGAHHLVDHGRTGLVAASILPRAIAARLEELGTQPRLAASLAANARADVAVRFPANAMIEGYRGLYFGDTVGVAGRPEEVGSGNGEAPE